MKIALLRSGTTKNPLEKDDSCAGQRPRITESAGKPLTLNLTQGTQVFFVVPLRIRTSRFVASRRGTDWPSETPATVCRHWIEKKRFRQESGSRGIADVTPLEDALSAIIVGTFLSRSPPDSPRRAPDGPGRRGGGPQAPARGYRYPGTTLWSVRGGTPHDASSDRGHDGRPGRDRAGDLRQAARARRRVGRLRPHHGGSGRNRAKTCPCNSRAVSRFFGGMLAPPSTARTLTLWIVPNGSDPLRAECLLTSRGIASLSGPIWDRANRVTQACHLERIAVRTTAELAVSEI